MEDNYKGNFIIIDDEPINNIICTKFLKKVCPEATIKTFTLPSEGLRYVIEESKNEAINKKILFLDINMPDINGWEVLDTFMTHPDFNKAKYTIYMLSSSIANEDKRKADTHALVSGFIEKPLTIASIQNLIAKQ